MDRVRCSHVAIIASFALCACSSHRGAPHESDGDSAVSTLEDGGIDIPPPPGRKSSSAAAGASGSDRRAGAPAAAGGGAGMPPAAGSVSPPAAGSSNPAAAGKAAPAAAGSAGDAANGGTGAAGTPAAPSSSQAIDCSRPGLSLLVDSYFKALEKHDPNMVPIAPGAKMTENAQPIKLGEGLWKTAGALAFRRNALDSESCGTLTEAVLDVQGMPTIVGVRLKLESSAISEVETYIALPMPGGYPATPMGLVNSAGDDWASILPAAQRSTRDELNAIADAYFESFTDAAVQPPYGMPCDLLANGSGDPTIHTCRSVVVPPIPGVFVVTPVIERRYPIADVEAGIAVGFGLATGNLLNFNMLKVVGGKIRYINMVFGTNMPAGSSGWD